MFESYREKDLQHVMQILVQLEAAGITDVRFARQRLHSFLYKPQKVRPARVNKIASMPRCPQCGGAMFPVANEEGLRILGCRKCRYSEIAK